MTDRIADVRTRCVSIPCNPVLGEGTPLLLRTVDVVAVNIATTSDLPGEGLAMSVNGNGGRAIYEVVEAMKHFGLNGAGEAMAPARRLSVIEGALSMPAEETGPKYLAPRHWMSALQIDVHVLDLRELQQFVLALLPADAGVLVAAEGRSDEVAG
jgi:hypothetical protein